MRWKGDDVDKTMGVVIVPRVPGEQRDGKVREEGHAIRQFGDARRLPRVARLLKDRKGLLVALLLPEEQRRVVEAARGLLVVRPEGTDVAWPATPPG